MPCHFCALPARHTLARRNLADGWEVRIQLCDRCHASALDPVRRALEQAWPAVKDRNAGADP